MRQLALTLLLALMLSIGSAQASSVPQNIESIARMARTSVAVPPEWDGIWTTVDTVYTCQGAFQATSPGADTLCGGHDFSSTAPSGLNLVCTGTADATTIDATCTGSEPVFTDCDANYNVVIHETLTGDTYFRVITVDVTYTGAACGPIPPVCRQINSHGARQGAASPTFCATPTRRSTWGELKIRYR